ncbi:CLUMA_CG018900, isoform A [Clunio marinus]|uniref:CLUMA_CG018900, isoform A n=1 Tax=Clunio marinus TaxID=568069 RepID=A0A1J1J4D5_9DIPT|nr:CLUMA_CG018900, isoform A [Clunio marinus]
MNFLTKLKSATSCTKLISITLRNLSVSSKPTTTLNSDYSIHLINNVNIDNTKSAKQNTNVIKDIGINGPLWRRKEIFEIPLTNKIIENPTQVNKVIEDVNKIDKSIELPMHDNRIVDDNGKQAAKHGMIMIRRRKMRKHKRRKLKKKMKFLWLKVTQRRELRKEKAFRAELLDQIREAEKFSAEEYVADRIRQATETPIPRFWKSKRYPKDLIRGFMEEEERKKEEKKYKMWEECRKQP